LEFVISNFSRGAAKISIFPFEGTLKPSAIK